MSRTVRIILAIVIAGLVLHAADLATRDCRVIMYVYDNCVWYQVRNYLFLPQNRFLRSVFMEGEGILLAFVLYLTYRYIFPGPRAGGGDSVPAAPGASEPKHPA